MRYLESWTRFQLYYRIVYIYLEVCNPVHLDTWKKEHRMQKKHYAIQAVESGMNSQTEGKGIEYLS